MKKFWAGLLSLAVAAMSAPVWAVSNEAEFVPESYKPAYEGEYYVKTGEKALDQYGEQHVLPILTRAQWEAPVTAVSVSCEACGSGHLQKILQVSEHPIERNVETKCFSHCFGTDVADVYEYTYRIECDSCGEVLQVYQLDGYKPYKCGGYE